MNHRTAPVSLRQRARLAGEAADSVLESLREAGLHTVVLSTCNRTEVYVAATDLGLAWRQIDCLLAQRLGLTTREIMAHVYGYEGPKAVRHLYRVACGLDSLLVGEAQVLGQVRDALERAEAARVAGPYLARLFQQALSAARCVRATTGLGRGAVSVGTAVVALTQRELGRVTGCGAVVIGAGHMARLAGLALAKRGASPLSVVNRSPQKARELASELGGTALPWSHLERALADADIVVSCTSASDIVLDRHIVERARSPRGDRPLLIIDIAVPRDVSPDVGAVPGVRLYDIDQLYPDEQTRTPEAVVAQAEAMVQQEAEQFMAWLRSREAVPAIQTLRQRAEAARRQELAECIRKLPHLGPQDRELLERMTTSLVNKLLHGPMVYLRQASTPYASVEVVEGLFSLPRSQHSRSSAKEAM